MYLVKVSVGDSKIDGKGVFTDEDIHENSVVWKFDSKHDKTLSQEELDLLDQNTRTNILRVAYLSRKTNRWVYPPNGDPALFTNHAELSNLKVAYDEKVSEEPFFVANCDIKKGEEITVNYSEFDNRPNDKVPDFQ